MEKYYPVIVVGGGPAGSACAKALTDQGIEALVIEKKKLPRHKCCSGILFGQTQELLQKHFGGLPPERVYCRPKVIKATEILEWKGKGEQSVYEWECPMGDRTFTDSHLNIWRNKFDHWLLKQSGGGIQDSTSFRGYASQGDKIKVEVSDGKSHSQLACSYLVGADGGDSLVRHVFDPSYRERANELAVYQVYYRYDDLGKFKNVTWYVFLGKFGIGLASMHKKDDYLALVVGAFKKSGGARKIMQQFEDFVAQQFGIKFSERERSEGVVMNDMFLRGDYCFGGGRVLFAGEAAGLLYLNGEGISVAIDSGYRAGLAIAKSLKGKSKAYESYYRDTEEIRQHARYCASRQTMIAAGPPPGVSA